MSDKRNRVTKACDLCRRRKRGCDGNQPCASCAQTNKQCTYNSTWATHPGRRAGSPSQQPSLTSPQPRSPISTSRNDVMRHAQRPVAASPSHSRENQKLLLQPDACSQSTVQQSGAGIISEAVPRFVQRTSAIAFPRLLGLSLKAERPPELQSFGYNLGLREEELSIDYGLLPVSRDDIRSYLDPFWKVPVEIFDRAWLETKIDEYYENPRPSLGTIIGLTFAIGSALSTQGHPAERDVVHWCKCCLEDSSVARRPSIEIIIGYALRLRYLRMTTRPNCVWLASCTAVHFIESVGLHREENITKLVEFSGMSSKALRILFWSTWALHRIISIEYGRSHIELAVTTQRVQSKFLELVMVKNLQELQDIELHGNKFLIYTRADYACYLFRRQWQSNSDIDETVLLKIANEALEAAASACADPEETLYFNTIGCVFQVVCMLIALASTSSFQKLDRGMEVLGMIADRVNTSMVKNALATANSLLGALINTKRGELDRLDEIHSRGFLETPGSNTMQEVYDFDWALFDDSFFTSTSDMLDTMGTMG